MPPFMQQLESFINAFPELVSRSLLAIAILAVSFLVSRWLARVVAGAARRQKAEAGVQEILRRLTRWGVMILGAVLAIEQVVPNVTSLLAGFGIAGLTIGFALQDVAKNLIAGILLLLQRPFEIGHSIEVSGFTGNVLDIKLRTTDIRTLDGRFVTIPNADVFVNPITNFSRAPSRRLEVSAGLSYRTDLRNARQLALEALAEIEGLLEDPPPEVIFRALGENEIQFVAYFWADMGKVSYGQAQSAGVQAVKDAFEREGVEFAVPSLELLKADS